MDKETKVIITNNNKDLLFRSNENWCLMIEQDLSDITGEGS